MMESPPSVGYVEDDELDLRGDLIEALNNAKTSKAAADKVQFLTEAREIVLHRDESKELLKEFAKDFAEFHTEKKAPVRMFVINFIEQAAKEYPRLIPELLSTLIHLTNDKNKKNVNKAWVTVMNVFRPCLKVLCDRDFYESSEADPDRVKNLSDQISSIKDSAMKLFADKKNAVMPVIDVMKTIALSYLLPDEEVIRINSKEVDRGPKEARADTGPDSFSLAMIPRDHPELSIVALEETGSLLVDLMCKRFLEIASEGNSISQDSAVKSVIICNALQILALHRPSVRKTTIHAMVEAARLMSVENEEDEVSHTKLQFIQNLRTNLLEFLKVKWYQHLKEWREMLATALGNIGAKSQAKSALDELRDRDRAVEKKEARRQDKEAREKERKLKLLEEQTRRGFRVVDALDAEEMRKNNYPPRQNTFSDEELGSLHQLKPHEAATLVKDLMDFLPGPPPPSSIHKKPSEAIRTFAQFASYIDREVSSKTVSGLTNAAQAVKNKTFAVAEKLEWRKLAFDRMQDQHKENVSSSALRMFTGETARMPSSGDAMVARVACMAMAQRSNAKDDLRPALLSFVAEDLTSRFGLALSTLFHVFAYSTMEKAAGGEAKSKTFQYDEVFLQLLEALLKAQQDKEAENSPHAQQLFREKSFTKLFTSAPRLPARVFPVLAQFCETKGKHLFGLRTLRDICQSRIAVRRQCLELLLLFAVNQESWVREDAIRCVANQVYPALQGEWKTLAEDFATGMLDSAVESISSSAATVNSPDKLLWDRVNEEKKELIASRKETSILCTLLKVKRENEEGNQMEQDQAPASEQGKKKAQGKEAVSEDMEVETKEGEDEYRDELDDEANLEYEDQEGFVQVEAHAAEQDMEKDLMRRIQLYVALCRRKTDMIRGYMQAYANIQNADCRKVLEDAVVLLIQVLGKQMGADQALGLFQQFPEGASPLLVHALNLLANEKICDSREKRQNLVAQAKAIQDEEQAYNLFETDDRFVIPVLGSLSRSEIRRYLMSILGMEQVYVRAAINSIIAGARFAHQVSSTEEEEEEEDLDSQPFLPNELLVTLVNMPISEDVTAQNIIDATEICLERRDIFTKDVLILVINDLLMQETLPKLSLRIMIRSIDQQPQTKQFIAEALQQLVDRQIWTLGDDDIWTGFVMCAIKLSTPGYPIIFRLPVQQLASAFEICKQAGGPSVVAQLVYFARRNQDALNLPPDVLDLLDSVSEGAPPTKKQKT